MADGSRKPVEDIVYGDYVKDFQGNPAMVDGIRIRSAFLKLPKREKFLINDSFLVTDGTTFLTPNYNFCVTGNSPFETSSTISFAIRTIPFIGEKNKLRDLWLWWDDSYRSKYDVISNGVTLLKENGKTEKVSKLREVQDSELDPSIDVCYVISTKGGTMWVNGYLVISRLNEDFDYNTMKPLDGEVTVIWNSDEQKYYRIVNIDHQTNLYGVWDKENDGWLDHWIFK